MNVTRHKRPLHASLLLLLALAFNCTCEPDPPRQLNAQTQELFATARARHQVEVRVDLENLHRSGLLAGERSKHSLLVEGLITLLPILAVRSEHPRERDFFTHGAVATWLLREWDAWPSVLELGLYLTPNLSHPEEPTESAVLLVGVDPLGAETEQFLKGIFAIDRAARLPQLQERKGSVLCLSEEMELGSFCAQAGHGWLALGSLESLKELTKARRTTGDRKDSLRTSGSASDSDSTPKPNSDSGSDSDLGAESDADLDSDLDSNSGADSGADSDSGSGSDTKPSQEPEPERNPASNSESPPLLYARVALPGFSSGDLTLSLPSDLQIEANLQAQSEAEAKALELTLGELVRLLVTHFEEAKRLLEPAVNETRAALEGDHEAPASLRHLASQLKAQRVLDRDGRLGALTQSLKLVREGKELHFSAQVPALLARHLAAESHKLATLGSLALAASLLLPKWHELQCQARQSEVRSSLAAAFSQQQARLNRGEAPALDFFELGFNSDPRSRYTYCMGDECLPCTHPACAEPQINPCSEALFMNLADPGEELFICAFGLPQLSAPAADNSQGPPPGLYDGEDLDIWIIGDSGVPMNIADACSSWP